jgi:predicted P-loop ATPase
MCCLKRPFDPVRDYLDGLEWDGQKRVDEWLMKYCRAAKTDLVSAFGRKALVAAVRRVRQPGCKFDYILTMESVEGFGKSSLAKLMAGPENFSDEKIIGLKPQVQQEQIQGIWIYEIGELEGIDRASLSHIKSFASKTVDRSRKAYGHSRVDQKRRCVFWATTNQDDYLRDTTGNRRWWPVKIGKIDLDAVARDRDQLWAEAAAIEATGEGLVIPEALWPDAAVATSKRMEEDPWQDMIRNRLIVLEKNVSSGAGKPFILALNDETGEPEYRVQSTYLLTDVIGISERDQQNYHTKRLAGVMRSLGWTRSEDPLRFGQKLLRGYRKRK